MLDLETLHRIWEHLMQNEEYDLAHEVSQEITARTIARNAILDHVEATNG